MRVFIKPCEIIELCLWDSYKQYYLPKDTDITKFLTDNVEFQIDEKEALVIGLLKTVETDNLVHKFNQYLDNYLNNKSSRINETFRTKKKGLLYTLLAFKEKFPKEWEPNLLYTKALSDVLIYVDDIYKRVDDMPVEVVEEKTGTYEYINCNTIKKILTYHN